MLDYESVCDNMINYFLLWLTFCLFDCYVCGFLTLQWSSIYWCEQMRELPVVVRVMEISLP